MKFKLIDNSKLIYIQNTIKYIISFLLTIIALLYFTNGMMFYYEYSKISIIISSFIFGLYIFSCMISNNQYDNYLLQPKSFNFKKFIKVIFMPSIILGSVTSIVYPDIINHFSLQGIMTFIEYNFTILIKQEDILWILPLIFGIFFYFLINFIIYWYFVLLLNIFILPMI
jgi:uncharacterized MnhB-related membrane protein